MPLVPREKIDDVRDRTNIVDVIKRYVEPEARRDRKLDALSD